MPAERISALEAWKTAFYLMGREIQVLLLLTLFMAILSVLFIYPWLGAYVGLLEMSMQAQPDPNAGLQLFNQFAGIWIWFIPFIFLMMGIYTVWSRAAILGREKAMEGGIAKLFNRTLWVFWRYICMIGWALLSMLGFTAIMFVVGMIFGAGALAALGNDLAGGGGSGIVMAIVIPLYLVFLFAMIGLILLFYISLHGEARDFRFPIHKSFQAMKGNLLRATGTIVGFYVIFYILFGVLIFLLAGAIFSASTWLVILAVIIIFAASVMFNFALLSFGAVYANNVAPGLKE